MPSNSAPRVPNAKGSGTVEPASHAVSKLQRSQPNATRFPRVIDVYGLSLSRPIAKFSSYIGPAVRLPLAPSAAKVMPTRDFVVSEKAFRTALVLGLS